MRPSRPKAGSGPGICRQRIYGRRISLAERVDLSLGASEAQLAAEVRTWLGSNVEAPPEFSDLAEAVEWGRRWQARLAAAGWVGIDWPAEYGGRGATPVEVAVFNSEYREKQSAATRQPRRYQPRRSDAAGARESRTAGALAPSDNHGRGDLVPAVQRAWCRFGSRRAVDASSPVG